MIVIDWWCSLCFVVGGLDLVCLMFLIRVFVCRFCVLCGGVCGGKFLCFCG